MPKTQALPTVNPTRTPRGYTLTFSLSNFGLYLAALAPTVGGLSVKIQSLVGLQDAPVQLGLITGVGALFALLTQPIAGRLSDRTVSKFGMRRPWILAGALATAIALVFCGLAPNVGLLLVAWCIAQTTVQFAFAAQGATLADQVPEERRGGVSGIVGAISPISLVVGAVLLTLLPTDLLRFAVPGIIGLLFAVIFAFTLKDRVRVNPPTTKWSIKQLLSTFVFNPRTHKDFGWAWLSKLLILTAYAGIATYLTLFLGEVFGMDISEQLAFNALTQIIGVATVVIFSIAGGFLSDRVKKRKPFVFWGGIIMSVGISFSVFAPLLGQSGLILILIGAAVLGAGAGIFFAVDQALCVALLPNPEDTAKDLGVLNIANSLPSSIAPFLAGVVIIPLGTLLFGAGSAGYMLWFGVAAVIGIVGAFLVTRIRSVA